MQNIDLDEAIKEVFEVKAFRAYVYFYYFENDGMQGEIINEAFKLSKKYALLHIENMLPPERKSQTEQALDVLRRKEFDSFDLSSRAALPPVEDAERGRGISCSEPFIL